MSSIIPVGENTVITAGTGITVTPDGAGGYTIGLTPGSAAGQILFTKGAGFPFTQSTAVATADANADVQLSASATSNTQLVLQARADQTGGSATIRQFKIERSDGTVSLGIDKEGIIYLGGASGTSDLTASRPAPNNFRFSGLAAATNTLVLIDGLVATERLLGFQTATSQRFAIGLTNGGEAGANAGSDLECKAYDDSAVLIDTVYTITRAATGRFTFYRAVSINDTTVSTNSTTGCLVLAGGLGVGGNVNVAGSFGVGALTVRGALTCTDAAGTGPGSITTVAGQNLTIFPATTGQLQLSAAPTTADATSSLIIGLKSAADTFVVQGFAAQSANIQEWQASTGAVIASVSASGALTLSNAAGTGDGLLTVVAGKNLTIRGEYVYFADTTGVYYPYIRTLKGANDDDGNRMDIAAGDGGDDTTLSGGNAGGNFQIAAGAGSNAQVASGGNGGNGGNLLFYAGTKGLKDGAGADGVDGFASIYSRTLQIFSKTTAGGSITFGGTTSYNSITTSSNLNLIISANGSGQLQLGALPTTVDATSSVLVGLEAATDTFVIQAYAAQSENIFEIQASTGAVLSSVSSAGVWSLGQFILNEGVTPASISTIGLEYIYGDSTTHELTISRNGSGWEKIARTALNRVATPSSILADHTTTGSICTIKATAHGLVNGSPVQLFGWTWTDSTINSVWPCTVINVNTFTVPCVGQAGNPSVVGTVIGLQVRSIPYGLSELGVNYGEITEYQTGGLSGAGSFYNLVTEVISGGVTDYVLHWGYNWLPYPLGGRAKKDEPYLVWGIESNYDSAHLMECNLDYQSASGLVDRRPFGIAIDRDTNAVNMYYRGSPITFTNDANSSVILSMFDSTLNYAMLGSNISYAAGLPAFRFNNTDAGSGAAQIYGSIGQSYDAGKCMVFGYYNSGYTANGFRLPDRAFIQSGSNSTNGLWIQATLANAPIVVTQNDGVTDRQRLLIDSSGVNVTSYLNTASLIQGIAPAIAPSATLGQHTSDNTYCTIKYTTASTAVPGMVVTLAAWVWGTAAINGTFFIYDCPTTTTFRIACAGQGVGSNPTVVGTVTVSAQVQLASAVTIPDANANVIIGCSAATKKGLVIQAAANQTASLQEWQSARAASLNVQVISEEVTVADAATTDSTNNLLPANSYIVGVTARVTTVLPGGPVTWKLGTAATDDLFAEALQPGALGQTTTTWNTGHAATLGGPAVQLMPFNNLTAAKIRITPSAAPGAATGKIRITVFYFSLTAPGS